MIRRPIHVTITTQTNSLQTSSIPIPFNRFFFARTDKADVFFQSTYPAIWTQTACRNLQRDIEFCFLAHFLGEDIGLPDKGLSLQNFSSQDL